MTTPPFASDAVSAAFDAIPQPARDRLLTLRALIYDEAAALPDIGPLQETLKWGQPAYLTPQSRAGTTLRLGVPKTGGVAIYAHCQSRVIPDFQAMFPDDFTFDGTRAVLFGDDAPLRMDKLRLLIRGALTYHRRARA